MTNNNSLLARLGLSDWFIQQLDENKMTRHQLARVISVHKNGFTLTNGNYATAMARIHYMRVKEKLPDAGDVTAQANYWKEYYNTKLGKGKPSEYIEKWHIYLKESNA